MDIVQPTGCWRWLRPWSRSAFLCQRLKGGDSRQSPLNKNDPSGDTRNTQSIAVRQAELILQRSRTSIWEPPFYQIFATGVGLCGCSPPVERARKIVEKWLAPGGKVFRGLMRLNALKRADPHGVS